jgi:ribose transport system ATP-binding protein
VTRALDSVDVTVARGEIHALLGENGAGKSTLVKILSGTVKPDSGVIELEGEAIEPSPKLSSRRGIVVVHQELSLLPNLSVAENILINDIPRRSGGAAAAAGIIDRRRLLTRAKASLALMALDIDPRTKVASLGPAERQLVEITRALALSPKVILLDEPTSSLPPDQRGALFQRLQRIRATGVGIVFITHFLEEALQISDRMTVLRDGRVVGTLEAAGASVARLVEMMTGRPAGSVFPKHEDPGAGAVARLSVESIVAPPRLRSVSFNVRPGEVVGLAGLVGSGRTETLKTVFGVLPIAAGGVRIDGKPVRFRSPADAIAAGIAFVPEDRQAESIFQNYSIMQNICVAAASSDRDPTLRSAGIVLNRRRMAAVAERLRTALQIKASSIRAPIASLSGGNQQKTILARWMAIKPSIVLADEPTRGVSIGSKIEIYRLIRRLAADGTAIVIASSEFEELVGLCSRVFIIRDGRTEGEIGVAGLTAEDLLHLVLAQAS